jgi:predicted alpha/beta-fold hydrolase
MKKIASNRNLSYIETADGGHCAFIGEPDGNGYDGRWAEREVVEFLKSVA